MPGKAAKIRITEKQQKVLQQLANAKSESKMISQRAEIILQSFQRVKNQDIAVAVKLERKQVGLWRRRWQTSWEALCVLECTEPKKLAGAIREILSDAHRSGAPGKFTAEQIALILALACEHPELSGLPITHWTHHELRDEIVKRKIVDSISVSYLGKILQKAALQPHRRKLWLNTTEKDPEVFAAETANICKTYMEAPQLQEEQGVHTVCTDEMTGIQALERAAESKPMATNKPARDEYEYIRHGTTTVIGNHDVITGEMIATTIGPTRTEADFAKHIENTLSIDPDGTWIFIVDCLNIHMSESLVNLVADRCHPGRDLGKKVHAAY